MSSYDVKTPMRRNTTDGVTSAWRKYGEIYSNSQFQTIYACAICLEYIEHYGHGYYTKSLGDFNRHIRKEHILNDMEYTTEEVITEEIAASAVKVIRKINDINSVGETLYGTAAAECVAAANGTASDAGPKADAGGRDGTDSGADADIGTDTDDNNASGASGSAGASNNDGANDDNGDDDDDDDGGGDGQSLILPLARRICRIWQTLDCEETNSGCDADVESSSACDRLSSRPRNMETPRADSSAGFVAANQTIIQQSAENIDDNSRADFESFAMAISFGSENEFEYRIRRMIRRLRYNSFNEGDAATAQRSVPNANDVNSSLHEDSTASGAIKLQSNQNENNGNTESKVDENNDGTPVTRKRVASKCTQTDNFNIDSKRSRICSNDKDEEAICSSKLQDDTTEKVCSTAPIKSDSDEQQGDDLQSNLNNLEQPQPQPQEHLHATTTNDSNINVVEANSNRNNNQLPAFSFQNMMAGNQNNSSFVGSNNNNNKNSNSLINNVNNRNGSNLYQSLNTNTVCHDILTEIGNFVFRGADGAAAAVAGGGHGGGGGITSGLFNTNCTLTANSAATNQPVVIRADDANMNGNTFIRRGMSDRLLASPSRFNFDDSEIMSITNQFSNNFVNQTHAQTQTNSQTNTNITHRTNNARNAMECSDLVGRHEIFNNNNNNSAMRCVESNHMATSVNNIFCLICGLHFRHRNELMQHIMQHPNNPTAEYAPSGSGNSNNTNTQNATKFTVSVGMLPRNYLEYREMASRNLVTPMPAVLACRYCTQKFRNQRLLYLHEESHLSNYQRHTLQSSRPFPSNTCDTNSFIQNSRCLHQRHNHGENAIPSVVKCSACQKLVLESNWQYHKDLHLRLRAKCSVCGRIYQRNQSLHIHSCRNHSNTYAPAECNETVPRNNTSNAWSIANYCNTMDIVNNSASGSMTSSTSSYSSVFFGNAPTPAVPIQSNLNNANPNQTTTPNAGNLEDYHNGYMTRDPTYMFPLFMPTNRHNNNTVNISLPENLFEGLNDDDDE